SRTGTLERRTSSRKFASSTSTTALIVPPRQGLDGRRFGLEAAVGIIAWPSGLRGGRANRPSGPGLRGPGRRRAEIEDRLDAADRQPPAILQVGGEARDQARRHGPADETHLAQGRDGRARAPPAPVAV